MKNKLRTGQVVEGRGRYRILRPLKKGKGGRGQVFLAEVLESPRRPRLPYKTLATDNPPIKGAMVVVKTVNFDKNRSPIEISDFIGEVNKTLQKEISLLPRLHGLKCVATTFDGGTWQTFLSDGAQVLISFIVQEYVKGDDIIGYLKNKSKNSTSLSRLTTAREWFRLAKHLVTATKEIHQRLVCHRDIWPTNIFIRSGRPVFIDFGEAVYRNETSVTPGVNQPKPHPYMAPEHRGGKRWPSRRSDLYSIGGVLYYMAVGEDPPLDPPKDNDLLKRSMERAIGKNRDLLAENAGIADIIARCLRHNRQKRVRDAEALLQELQNFDVHVKPPGAKQALKRVQRQANVLSTRKNELFARIVEVELRKLETRIQDMTNGILDITGNHEEIVYGLTQYLSILREGDEYLAVSTPQFWSAGNMGINGRYLTMNKLMAERGVRIRRAFLLTEQEDDNSEVKEIVRAHVELHGNLPDSKKQMMEMRYLIVNSHHRKDAIQSGKHFGVWIRRDGMMKIIPVYDDRNVITTVRLRRPEESEAILRRQFSEYFDAKKVRSLERWLRREHRQG